MANDTDEKRGENKGESGDEKESEAEDKLDELVGNYGEEEKYSEEEVDYESEGEDEEKVSESEGEDEESEEENENASGESEGSMAIGNTVIAPSKEVSGEKSTEETEPLLTPFTGDEEVIRNEDNLPMSVVGKKRKKASMKATKSVIPVRKEVAFHVRTPFTRSKRKVVDEQIIKESRGSKKPGKQVPVIEPVIELDVEDESDSTLQEKTSA
uniref:Neurofilament medium polypeptide-like n=1 Tax=Nicotiana tabacum TaxID=4097 RepID=A0A1S4CIA0_TOBAC|nr:PREDICTED: neurofilament medium polypeptide-like [Nicotiana tabacum]